MKKKSAAKKSNSSRKAKKTKHESDSLSRTSLGPEAGKAPFQRMPVEMLTEIFLIWHAKEWKTLRGDTGPGLMSEMTKCPMAITQVCQSFRDLAHSIPGLWEYLSVSLGTGKFKHHLTMADEWFSRAKDLPIQLYLSASTKANGVPRQLLLHIPKKHNFAGLHTFLPRSLYYEFHAIIIEMQQAKEMSILVDHEDSPTWGDSLYWELPPKLERFALGSPADLNNPRVPNRCVGLPPPIQFCAYDIAFQKHFPSGTLRSLNIFTAVQDDVFRYIQLVSPDQIESLTFRVDLTRFAWTGHTVRLPVDIVGPVPPKRLPKVHTLDLRFHTVDGVINILERLTLPGLKNLRLTSSQDLWTTIPFLTALKRLHGREPFALEKLWIDNMMLSISELKEFLQLCGNGTKELTYDMSKDNKSYSLERFLDAMSSGVSSLAPYLMSLRIVGLKQEAWVPDEKLVDLVRSREAELRRISVDYHDGNKFASKDAKKTLNRIRKEGKVTMELERTKGIWEWEF